MTDESDIWTKFARQLPAGFRLSHGSHPSFEDGACLMEAVAYVAGEPHSDAPKCASPALTRIATQLNDRWGDDDRQLLTRLIPRLVGTRTTSDHDRRRMYVMLDASVREIAPMGLDAVKWADLAERLRAIAPIVDRASAQSSRPLIKTIQNEARSRHTSASAYAADASAYAAADASAYAAYAAAATYSAADASAYAAYAAASAADAAAYAAYSAAYASAYASYAAASAASYAADVAAYAKISSEERARIRAAARRPIIEATVRAFERAIALP